MTTIENNKLIAEFMGLVESSIKNEYWTKKSKEGFGCGQLTELKYNSDWNRLIEVVKKIKSIDTAKIIGKTYYDDWLVVINQALLITDIDKVYSICVEFIKWHNEQNK